MRCRRRSLASIVLGWTPAARLLVQATMAALSLWIGVQFYLWVRFFEQGGQSISPDRPAGVEGWLPIAGLMNLKSWLVTGHIPLIHPAAAILLAAFLIVSLVLKKAFCSWICPIGALSEMLWRLGLVWPGKSLRLPRWLDLPLRGVKYLLLAFFAVIILGMSTESIDAFMATPYGLLADVKMLNFFRFITPTTAAVILGLIVASLVIRNVWCRYLCPYGALMGLISLASPFAIRRNQKSCIGCSRCAQACPAFLPVDRQKRISSPECTACLSCVAACPVANTLTFSTPGRHEAQRLALGARTIGIAIVVFLFGAVTIARITGHWETELPDQIYRDLIPKAAHLKHPGM